jgi:hypothetical protein
MVTEGHGQVNLLSGKFIERFGPVSRYIDTNLFHGGNGLPADP